jgi:hypothetical protein
MKSENILQEKHSPIKDKIKSIKYSRLNPHDFCLYLIDGMIDYKINDNIIHWKKDDIILFSQDYSNNLLIGNYDELYSHIYNRYKCDVFQVVRDCISKYENMKWFTLQFALIGDGHY